MEIIFLMFLTIVVLGEFTIILKRKRKVTIRLNGLFFIFLDYIGKRNYSDSPKVIPFISVEIKHLNNDLSI